MKTGWIWKMMVVAALLALLAVGCSSSDDPITDGDQPDGDTDGDEPDGDTDGDEPDGDEPDGDTPDGDEPDGDGPDGDTPDGDTPDGDWEGSKCDVNRNAPDRDVSADDGGTVQLCSEGDELDGTAFRINGGDLLNDVHVVIGKTDDLAMEGWIPVGPAIQFKATPKNAGESVALEGDASISIPFVIADLPERARDFHINVICKLDPDLGVTNGDDNAAYFLPATQGLLHVDRERQLLHFDNNHFATYQAFVRSEILEPTTRRFTYRAIAGISMGAGGASTLGLKHHEMFDLLGPMGGLMDMGYLIANMRKFYMGGFCDRETILADTTPAAIDAFVTNVDAHCGWFGYQRNPLDWSNPTQKWYMVEPREIYPDEHAQGYNHWYFDNSGGDFDREEYTKLFRDLGYAYGNPTNYNPESPYIAAGVTGDRLTYFLENVYAQEEIDACNALATYMATDPITGLYDAEYNPTAEYPVIMYCEMEGHASGDYVPGDPKDRRRRFDLALAVDYNKNGLRDYGEPVIRQFWEPWQDCGSDGLCNEDETGYNADTNPDPAGDDYNPYTNPTGTEGNFLYEDGEPYEDKGLDGVVCPGCESGCEADTCEPCEFDFGECNGEFDVNPNIKRYYEYDPIQMVHKMDIAALKRLNVWIDAGIRDLFNFAVMGDNLHAALDNRLAAEGLKTSTVQSFPALMSPQPERLGNFKFLKPNYAQLGQVVNMRYGRYDASDLDVFNGDGRHVGYPTQVVFRVQTFFSYANAVFPNGDFDPVETWSTDNTLLKDRFYSDALKRDQKYSVALPPGYFTANQEGGEGQPDVCTRRYPVIYLMHGYGQKPEDLAAAMPIIQIYMAEGRFQKLIIVFPDGKCDSPSQCMGDCDKDCPAGPDEQTCIDQCVAERDCANVHRECEKGNFYANHVATYDNPTGTPGDDDFMEAQIEDSLMDLIAHIDSNYCARTEEVVEVDGETLLGLY